jgi:hypothetical protein
VLPEIVGTSLDKGREIDALAKLPEAEQRSLAEAARRGENVSAIIACNVCDPEDSKVSDENEEVELGKVIARVRRAQPRNKDTMIICDALERRLRRDWRQLGRRPSPAPATNSARAPRTSWRQGRVRAAAP